MINVIDNFLPYIDNEILGRALTDQQVTWVGSNAVYDDDPLSPRCDPKYNFQLCHVFLESKSQVMINKNTFHLLDTLVKKINATEWVRIKLNLTPCNSQIIEHGFHIDHNSPRPDSWTAIYYVNSNDGYTLFEDGTKIESIRNRFVIFPSKLRHSGTNCTDVYARLVLNLNFFKDSIEDLISARL
jgi:hypothetical protein